MNTTYLLIVAVDKDKESPEHDFLFKKAQLNIDRISERPLDSLSGNEKLLRINRYYDFFVCTVRPGEIPIETDTGKASLAKRIVREIFQDPGKQIDLDDFTAEIESTVKFTWILLPMAELTNPYANSRLIDMTGAVGGIGSER